MGWLIAYLLIALLIIFWFFIDTGRDGLEDAPFLFVASLMWPILSVAAIMASPFLLVGWLGIKLHERFK